MKTIIELLRKRYFEILPDFFELSNFSDSYLKHLFGYEKFFGEYFGSWLSQLYSIKNKSFQFDFSFGSILLRSYMIMQDDMIDRDLEKSANNILISDFFLTKSLEIFSSLVKSKDLFWEKYNELFKKYIYANKEFSRKMLNPSDYNIHDFENYFERICLIKLPMFVIQQKSNVKDFQCNYYHAIKHLYLALQFSDDLCDWKKDYCAGRYTYPLSLIIKVFRDEGLNKNKRMKYISAVNDILIKSNLPKFIFDLIKFHIEKSLEYLSINPQSYLNTFLIGMKEFIYNEENRIEINLRNWRTKTYDPIFIVESFDEHKIIKLNVINKLKIQDIAISDFKEGNLFSSLSPPYIQKKSLAYVLKRS